MNIYLISNNLVLSNINYETVARIDEKRKNRPLAIAGEKLAQKLASKLVVNEIYSSTYASALATAKYVASSNNLEIRINRNLDDVLIGESRHNIKMLRFMQDKNFDYKYTNGESLNDARKRMQTFLKSIIAKNSDVAIFTHKRAIMALLLNFCEAGYNLDEHLILSYHDKVILDDVETGMDILKLSIQDNKVINITNWN